MTIADEIAVLRGRILKAEVERDRFLAAGMQERHLEACSLIDALELQLEHEHQAGLRARQDDETLLADLRIAERIAHNAGHAMADEPENRKRLMRAYGITFDGRQYLYDRYHYDRLADAVNFARLQHSRAGSGDPLEVPCPRIGNAVEKPSDLQREEMIKLGIRFEDGVYHLGDYRYDRLSDAVEYARLKT
jgi:hypothetical protein